MFSVLAILSPHINYSIKINISLEAKRAKSNLINVVAFQCTESAQEVICVMSGESAPVNLGALRIQQIACAEKLALLLTQEGTVYTLPYDTMTPQLVPGMERIY